MIKIKRLIFVLVSLGLVVAIGLGAFAANTFAYDYFYHDGPRLLSTGEELANIGQILEKDTLLVVTVFFHTKCPSCKQLMDELQAYYYPPYIMVVGINVGQSKHTVQKMVNDRGYTFPILLGQKDLPEGIQGVPYTEMITQTETGWQYVANGSFQGKATGYPLPQEAMEVLGFVNDFVEEL